MAIRLGAAILLLAMALAVLADSSPTLDTVFGLTSLAGSKGGDGLGGLVADFIDEDEEMSVESETARRTLAGRPRYISYDAMRRGNVPCSRRGNSYYACNAHGRANPYQRSCTRISRCPRNTRWGPSLNPMCYRWKWRKRRSLRMVSSKSKWCSRNNIANKIVGWLINLNCSDFSTPVHCKCRFLQFSFCSPLFYFCDHCRRLVVGYW